MLFVNPNQDNAVASTDVLNYVSKAFRNNSLMRFVKEEGFELNPMDFKWEWIINFNNGKFIAIKEDKMNFKGTMLPCAKAFLYQHDNDLEPIQVACVLSHQSYSPYPSADKAKVLNTAGLIKIVKELYYDGKPSKQVY